MHRVADVLYESCWRLAHSSSGRDVCVTSFFQTFWRDGSSLPLWEGYRNLKSNSIFRRSFATSLSFVRPAARRSTALYLAPLHSSHRATNRVGSSCPRSFGGVFLLTPYSAKSAARGRACVRAGRAACVRACVRACGRSKRACVRATDRPCVRSACVRGWMAMEPSSFISVFRSVAACAK